MKVDHNSTLQNNSQIALLSKTENTAAHGSNTTTNKTQKDTATVQATPLELGELHKSENFTSNGLEQLKRLAQIRETLDKSGKDHKGDKKADALSLDLLNTIKANLTPDEKNSSVKNQHLETLKTNIESKKYTDAIKGVGQMMELFEMESRGAFTPVKNTKGGTVDTLLDTIISFTFGDLVGPGIVKMFKHAGHGVIDKTSFSENGKLVANLGAGGVGFVAAEKSIELFLDPQWKKIFPKLRQFLDDKVPDLLINLNKSGDKAIKSLVHGFLGLFGKKLEGVDPANTDFKSEELKDRVIDYIKNRAEYDHKDELHFSKLTKEMLRDNYEKLYGKKMPLPVAKILDMAFSCVAEDPKIHPSRICLLANEAALVAKPILDKLGPPGNVIFHFFNDVVPNAYIFATRPIAMFAINHKEKEILEMANNIVKLERKPVDANSQKPELLTNK